MIDHELSDEDFVFSTNLHYHKSPACLAVEPGVIDFPARCVRAPDHKGLPHASATGYIGGAPADITYWNDDE
jgi:hypothetical protein